MGAQTFYGKEIHLFSRAVSLAARHSVTVSGIPSRLNYCVIFMLYT